MDGRLTYKKEERLHHRSLVEKLFRKGKSFYEFPLRVTWLIHSDQELTQNFCNYVPDGIGRLQMMVTVPKKKRRRAVDRVLLRRRIREAYRLNRMPLKKMIEESPSIRSLSVSFIYIHDENMPFDIIEEKMIKAINKLENLISK